MFDNTFLCTAYADDSTLFLEDKNSIRELLYTVNYVTYEFESQSTLYSCLNVTELLAPSRRHILRLSDSNGTWSKEFLGIQATVECGFTLKLVRDMIKTCNQMHRTVKYSQLSSIIWPVWLNG